MCSIGAGVRQHSLLFYIRLHDNLTNLCDESHLSHEFYQPLGRHPGVPDLVLAAVPPTGAKLYNHSLAQTLPIKTRLIENQSTTLHAPILPTRTELAIRLNAYFSLTQDVFNMNFQSTLYLSNQTPYTKLKSHKQTEIDIPLLCFRTEILILILNLPCTYSIRPLHYYPNL